MFSKALPKNIPLATLVFGFGRSPVLNNPVIKIIYNQADGSSAQQEFKKLDGCWHDQEGLLLDDEDQIIVETIWRGECEKMGVDHED